MAVAAGAALVLPDGRWVMQRRSHDAPTDPNGLSFFGGYLEGDETPSQALLRELAEETNLAIEARDYPLVCEPVVTKRNGKDFQLHVFYVEIPSLDFEIYEGKAAEAFTLAELRERNDLSDVAQLVLKSIGDK